MVDKGFFSDPTVEEIEFLKPNLEPTDVTRHAVITEPSKEMIYSTTANTATRPLPERLINHLERYREIMEQRRENRSGRIEFFHLHWPRNAMFFDVGPKILAVRKCEEPTFAYTDDEAYVMMAFNVIRSNRIDLHYLTGLLNSRLARFWFRCKGKMQGQHFQIDKEPLLAFPIHAPKKADQKKIAGLVKKIILSKQQLSIAMTDAEITQLDRYVRRWENEIEKELYYLYELSKDDIELLKQY